MLPSSVPPVDASSVQALPPTAPHLYLQQVALVVLAILGLLGHRAIRAHLVGHAGLQDPCLVCQEGIYVQEAGTVVADLEAYSEGRTVTSWHRHFPEGALSPLRRFGLLAHV